ncbi:hypothetical protein GCM10025867_42720 [Frondihabitans sucicola]|uniref:LPXTG cell wall anchor domain-containing protein n=1 Tax=Frondihabitans sucicola TaxID=1268041 RepID=A0ABM8GU74_9MICO|nr:hypothetical protein [Frondihabitans sucicola]BDZ52031.1 hypothetical protein GCM10025867_42720 [Frondihabitans sucicola]
MAAQAGVLDGTSAVAVGSAPGGALTVVVLVLGVALVGASAAVAVALYRRREL